MNVYVWSFLLVACAAVWPFAKRHSATGFERLSVSLAMILLSIVASIGVSLLVFGRPRLIIILPIASACIAGLVLVLRTRTLKAKKASTKPKYGRAVAMIALAVVIVGFGRQFQFASFWGDIGVYTMEAQHHMAGGAVTFEYSTSRLNIPPKSTQPSVPNGMNEASAGGRQFHALPTWPSFMALLGPSFDVAAILSLLFGLSIGLFYLLVCEVCDDGVPTLLTTILLALLPLAWFLSLYATAEMLLLTITLATSFLYVKTGFHPFVLGLGVFAFGVVHISLFVISPLIGFVIFIAAINVDAYKRSRLATGSVIAAASGLMAMWFAMHVSQKYALDIVRGTFGSRGYLSWIASVSSLVGGIPFVLGLLGSRPLWALRNAYGYCRQRAAIIGISVTAVILCVVAIQLYMMGWTTYYVPLETSIYSSSSARVSYMNSGLMSIAHHSMLSLMAASGLVGLAAFFVLPFVWIKERGVATAEHLTWVVAAYVVILYGVLHVDVTNNYYASRYLLPVAVPALLMLGVFWLSRWRVGARRTVAIIGFVSLYYISALLSQGFFLGDRQFIKNIMRNVDVNSNVYVEGSIWLDYMLVPPLANTERMSASLANSAGSNRDQLITDAANVVGGYKTCYSYDQRRIPWQISYPLHPQIEEHDVCVVLPSPVGGMNLPGNQWMTGGEFKFIAVGSATKRNVVIEIDSLGWWASKRPFISDLKAIKPSLLVCGNEFQLLSLTPQLVVFQGEMSAPFCHAILKTATFTPSTLGEGQDTRALGIDMYSVRIHDI